MNIDFDERNRRTSDMDMEFITKTRFLIENEECWAKGFPAMNKHGIVVDILSPNAQVFCMFASLHKVAIDYPTVVYQRCYDILRNIVEEKTEEYMSLTRYNDLPDTTHKDVLAIFDEAIERINPC